MVPNSASPEAALARAPGTVFQQPAEFEPGKVGGERKAGLAAKPVLAALLAKLGDEPVRACVLPDNRVAERLSGATVPKQRRLALVGDADADKIGGGKPGRGERIRHGGDGVPPNLGCVVLDPARLRINLLVLLLRGADNRAFPVENEKACGCRALVDRANETRACYLLRNSGGVSLAIIELDRFSLGFRQMQAELGASPEDIIRRSSPFVTREVVEFGLGQSTAEIAAEISHAAGGI